MDKIPPRIQQLWLERINEDMPGWRPDEADWLLAAGALLQFFDSCKEQSDKGECALPSRAADSVWHLWLKHEPAGLAAFQQQHFGIVLPHVERAEMQAPLDQSLSRCWVAACRNEGLSPLGRKLPLLFAADRLLKAPNGWAYRFGGYGSQLFHQDQDERGRPVGRPSPHPAMGVAAMAGLGLLSYEEIAMAERRKAMSDGGSGGSSCGSSSSCGDGGGGCSCGSSCGGGGCGS
ncbi:hypothetical protein [Pelomonas sp. SE-A7]|uniref:hypothetical protein n=1 Tax=Pelomonas sp. SE-A7 TaxID=3054953 RepID=UPI00259D14EC|nr:hypothetical protein [Pelomonas sp. SE-A7]MDM4765158.1 hypothetical protein [Pelomonas sp. SE-A7]